MMTKGRAAWLLAMAAFGLLPTTQVVAQVLPARVWLAQQTPAVPEQKPTTEVWQLQKEKLAGPMLAQSNPVLPDASAQSKAADDGMVWRITWISTRDKNFKEQADRLARDGWEPFAMATYPVTEFKRGEPVDQHYIFFAYRRKFPQSFVP